MTKTASQKLKLGLSLLLFMLLLASACIQEEKTREEEKSTGEKAPGVEKPSQEQGKAVKPAPKPEVRLSFDILWSLNTGDKVYGVALAASGTRAAVGSFNEFLYLLDANGKELWRFKTRGSVQDVALSMDGAYVAAVSYVYDESTVYLLTGNGEKVWSVSMPGLARGVDVDKKSRVAVATYRERVYMIDREIRWEHVLPESAYGAWDVVFAGDKVLAVDDNALLYSFNTEGKLLQKIKVAKKDYPYGVATGPGGYTAVVTQKGGVYLYKDGKLRWSRKMGSPGERLVAGYGVAISDAGELVAVGSWDKNLYIYSIDGKLLLKHTVGDHVNRVAFSGDRIIFGSTSGLAYLAEVKVEVKHG